MLGITIRSNAAVDEIRIADGPTFNRAAMSPADRKKVNRLIRAIVKHSLEDTHG